MKTIKDLGRVLYLIGFALLIATAQQRDKWATCGFVLVWLGATLEFSARRPQ